jgi:hypothetical protein
MVDLNRLPSTNFLSYSCECFKNDDILTNTKTPKSDEDYIQKEKKKCELMYSEVYKHQYFNFEEEIKTCYAVSETLSLVLRNSLYRHKASLKRLNSALKTEGKKICYIKLKNGTKVPVNVYTQTVKQLLQANLNVLTNFTDAYSLVDINKLKESEQNHCDTLSILENVIKRTGDGFDKLEIPIQSSL